MKRRLLSLAIVVIGALGLVVPLVMSGPVFASGSGSAVNVPGCGDCTNPTTTKCITRCAVCQADPDKCQGDDIGGIVQKVIKVLLFIIGAASVVMIIVGGVRYVTSAGNPEAVKGAKNTIVYAIVGLVVAILAYAIVTFVINNIASAPASSTSTTPPTSPAETPSLSAE